MLPDSITALIAALGKLPGVGPRSAERIALHLVQTDPAAVKQLAETILLAREKIQFCDICGALTEKSPCSICADARRDASLVCVVERAVDILSIEKSGTYRGKFHVLGGKISPLDGVEPEDLRIAELEKRLEHEPIKEIVIALGTDVEGDATSSLPRQAAGAPGAENLAHRLRPARRQRTGIRRRTDLEPRAGRPPGNDLISGRKPAQKAQIQNSRLACSDTFCDFCAS